MVSAALVRSSWPTTGPSRDGGSCPTPTLVPSCGVARHCGRSSLKVGVGSTDEAISPMTTLANYLDDLGTLHQLDAATHVREAVVYMSDRRIGAVAVTIFGEVVGILTERDVLKRGVAAGLDLDETALYDIMTPMLVTAELTDSVDETVDQMQRLGARHVVVQHPRRPADFVGFLCRDELLLAEHKRRSNVIPLGVPRAMVDDGTGSMPIDLAA